MKAEFLKFISETKSLFPYPEDLADDFLQLFTHPDAVGFVNILNKKTKGKFKEGFSYRTLNYWEQEGIIPEDRNKEGNWRNYSILDQIWLNIVISLRSFGMKSNAILKVRNYVNAFEEEVASSYPLIALYQAKSITKKYCQYYLLVMEDGCCQLILKDDFVTHFSTASYVGEFITIDISFLMESITKTQLSLDKIDSQDFKVIRGTDLLIHNEISDKDYDKVTVRKDKSGNPALIESERDIDSKTITGLATKNVDYGEVTEKIVDGQIVHKRLIKKKKI